MQRLPIARLALRAVSEVLRLTPAALVDVVAFNGNVNANPGQVCLGQGEPRSRSGSCG